MPPRTTRLVPPKHQNLAIAIELGICGFLGGELYRVYKGTHPTMSRRLQEGGIWPPPKLPAVKEGEKKEGQGEEKKEADVRWMSINGVPVPASFDALTGFWRR